MNDGPPPPAGAVPSADAFYLPADSCRQARLWLPWPSGPLREAVATVVRAAAAFEPVALLTAAGEAVPARRTFGSDIVDALPLAPRSARLRDTGPTFLVDGKGGSAAVDWRFDGWGKRGDGGDAGLAHALLGAAEVRRFRAPLTLEGSAIAADGRGTVLALEASVFDPARNPGLAPLDAFAILKGWVGAARVIWIAQAHPADMLVSDLRALASFVAPGLVAVTDSDAPAFAAVADHLARSRDGRGRTLELLRLPAPPDGAGLASYSNFLPLNGGVLVPAFGAASDARAADILAGCFPDRAVQLVPARDLALAGVTLTSLALPHPARLLERDRATVLPRSAWSQPTPDVDGLLQHYIDLAERER